jgi:hypothetical protein
MWWLLRCSSLLLVTCMKCLSALILCQRATHLVALVGRFVTERNGYWWSLDWGYGFLTTVLFLGDRGGTVVKALRYKSEGRWFDSR